MSDCFAQTTRGDGPDCGPEVEALHAVRRRECAKAVASGGREPAHSGQCIANSFQREGALCTLALCCHACFETQPGRRWSFCFTGWLAASDHSRRQGGNQARVQGARLPPARCTCVTCQAAACNGMFDEVLLSSVVTKPRVAPDLAVTRFLPAEGDLDFYHMHREGYALPL